MIGRFIQKQHVVLFQQEFEHCDSCTFSTTEFLQRGCDHLFGELELTQHGTNGAVIHARLQFLDLFNRSQVELKRAMILMEVSNLNAGSNIDFAIIEIHLTVDDSEQSCFAGAIGTDNPNLLTAAHSHLHLVQDGVLQAIESE